MFLGHYNKLIPDLFVKFELFFTISTLLELPFLFQTYVSHLKTFWRVEVHKSFYVKKGTIYSAQRPSEYIMATEGSESTSRPDVIMVMALMDIDFVNQYRAAAMSQFSGEHEFDDVESQDDELSLNS